MGSCFGILLAGGGGSLVHCCSCIYTMSFSTSFFLIFRKWHCLWKELIPAVMHSPQSYFHPDPHPWSGYCLAGFTVLMSTPLCVECCPADAPFIALLWLQQAFQCGELTASDHRSDQADIIVSYDFFFSLPNRGTFLEFSGLLIPAFPGLLVPASGGGKNVADLSFKFHD